jgi:hypothetical protein
MLSDRKFISRKRRKHTAREREINMRKEAPGCVTLPNRKTDPLCTDIFVWVWKREEN